MQRITLFSLTVLLAALATTSACDRQVDNSFEGKPFLAIKASLSMAKGFEDMQLVPVIAWLAETPFEDDGQQIGPTPYYEIMDVDFKGAFPSNLTISVNDTPSPSTYTRPIVSRDRGEPLVAIGSIAAMASSHPDAVYTDVFTPGLDMSDTEPRPIDYCNSEVFTCPYPPGPEYYSEYTSFTDYYPQEKCFFEKIDCTDQDLDGVEDECDVSLGTNNCSACIEPKPNGCKLVDSRGNSSVAIAGYSTNIVVAYFIDDVPAETDLSYAYNLGGSIDAGYHVYRVTEDPDYESYRNLPWGQGPECLVQAQKAAVEQYNKKYGTNATVDNIFSAPPMSEDASFDLFQFECKLLIENNCPHGCGWQWLTPIDDPVADPISIELGAVNTYRKFPF